MLALMMFAGMIYQSLVNYSIENTVDNRIEAKMSVYMSLTPAALSEVEI